MRITMKTLYATPERSIAAGATAEVPDKEARDLIAKGYAVPEDADEADGKAPGGRPKAAKATRGRAAGRGRRSDEDDGAAGDDQGDGAGDDGPGDGETD